MTTEYENGRDDSGHSGQACKHWRWRVPSHFRPVGTTRDKRPGVSKDRVSVQFPRLFDLDSSGTREQPMSRAKATE
jgi:hypothetical protein